jgi:hypothetical protein
MSKINYQKLRVELAYLNGFIEALGKIPKVELEELNKLANMDLEEPTE